MAITRTARRALFLSALALWAMAAFCLGRWSATTSAVEAPYDGPVFDAMAQIDETVDLDRAVRWVRDAGVSKIALFARSRTRLGENEEALLRLRDRHPDLIVLGSPKFFQQRDDLDPAWAAATVEGIRTHRYAFVGEIMFTHGDKWDGTQNRQGERYVNPEAPRVRAFLDALAPLRVPVLAHWEMYDWERDHASFSALFASHPEQTFIVPHMGFGTPAQVRAVLDAHPNVLMTLSKKKWKTDKLSGEDKAARLGEGLVDERDRLLPAWREILETYSTRILYASDPNRDYLWESYGEILGQYRKLAGQLPRQVAENIFHRNAERLYGSATAR